MEVQLGKATIASVPDDLVLELRVLGLQGEFVVIFDMMVKMYPHVTEKGHEAILLAIDVLKEA